VFSSLCGEGGRSCLRALISLDRVSADGAAGGEDFDAHVLALLGPLVNAGGPRTLVWILVSAMTLVVGLAIAEICGAMPISGARYYWASRLAPHCLRVT
jgi:amino acid transporter